MKINEITSRKNSSILWALSLHDKKARDNEGVFFTEGKKLYLEGIERGLLPEKVFVTKEALDLLKDVSGKEIFLVTNEVYNKITDEKSPEGIFAVFKKPVFELKKEKSALLLLEGIQDPGNLGTLLRTAVAFGMGEVILVNCADVFSPKTVRSAMGAVFKISTKNFSSIDQAVFYAREKSDSIIATALHTESLDIRDVDTSYSTVMIGSEGRGLSDRAIELADKKVIIPITDTESLNAGVAGAIFMYDSMVKRKK